MIQLDDRDKDQSLLIHPSIHSTGSKPIHLDHEATCRISQSERVVVGRSLDSLFEQLQQK